MALVSAVDGRTLLRESLARVARAPLSGPGRTILLRGDAGIGKTTLLDEVAKAPAELRVLRMTGVEAEGTMPLAGLNMLLLAVIDPSSRLTTLLTGDEAPSTLAIASAVLAAVADAARSGPILLLIDDAHWIDAESGLALVFALRRLTREHVSAIVAVRNGETSPFDDAGFEELTVGGLAWDQARALGEADDDGSTTPIAEAVLRECWVRTAGNPLALQEAIHTLDPSQRAGLAPLPAVLAPGGRLVDALARRILALPTTTHAALAVVAASDDNRAGPIAAAVTEGGGSLADLRPAERASIVRLAAGEIDLVHPLFRPAIAAVVGPEQMRHAHAALAGVLDRDGAKAAWHLAAAAVGPDETAATALTTAGSRAIAQGAPTVAAQAFERAARLSSDPGRKFERLFLAGRARWDANDPPSAHELLTAARDLAPDDSARAKVAGDLGDVIGWSFSVIDGVQLIVDAARAVEDSEPTTAALLDLRAALLLGLGGDGPRSFALANRGVELLGSDDPALALAARAIRGAHAQLTGYRAIADDDLAAVDALGDLPLEMVDTQILLVLQAIAYARLMREEHDRAGQVLELVQRAARRLGQPGAIGFAGALASEIAFRRGRFGEALAEADLDIASKQGRSDPTAYFGHAARARAEAVLGQQVDARRHANEARTTGEAIGMRGLQTWAEAAEGLSRLSQGEAAAAVHPLRLARQHAADYVEPSLVWFGSDLVDALIELGHLDEARAVAHQTATCAAKSGSRWGGALEARTIGRLDRDEGAVHHSIDVLDALGAEFERARSLLALGESFGHTDRAEEAAAEFDRMGARPWADRAWAASRRRRPDQPDRVATLLTSAEFRVAAAVSRGLSNREVADELFLSPKTVDAHLRSIYPKLGVRRRTELAVRFNAER